MNDVTPAAIDAYLDAATSGLSGDPELRFDVRAELGSHIAERLERTDGDDPSAGDDALKRMGAVADVAAALMEGNLKRMRKRAAARIVLTFVLVPLALLSALLFSPLPRWLMQGSSPLGELLAMGGKSRGPGRALLVLATGGLPARQCPNSEEQALLRQWDHRQQQLETARSLRALRPDDPVYLGHYIANLTAAQPSTDGGHPDEAYVTELLNAAETEPDNARYGYLLASHWFEAACRLEARDDGDPRYRLIVHDRTLLDQAMAKLLDSSNKPYYRRYARDMLGRQLDATGKPDNLTTAIIRVATAAGVLLPDLADFRNMTKAANAYAELLISEGRIEEALPYLSSWEAMSTHLLSDAFTLIDVLVVGAVTENGATAGEILTESGHEDEGLAMTAKAEQYGAPVKAWRTAVRERPNNATEMLRKHAGVLDALLLPALGDEEFDPGLITAGRLLDYNLAEMLAFRVLLIAAAAMLVGAWLVGLRWRIAGGNRFMAVLLIPPAHAWLRIIGYGVCLPVVAYFMLTRVPAIGGRDYGIRLNGIRAMTQVGVLITVVVSLTLHLSINAVRTRCRELAIACPARNAGRRIFTVLFRAGLALAGILAFLPAGAPTSAIRTGSGAGSLIILSLLLLALVLTAPFRLAICLRRSTYGSYFGTAARTLVPLLAGVVLIMSWLSGPYLYRRETNLIRRSSLGADTIGFTVVEDRVTQRLKERLQEVRKPTASRSGI